MKRERSTSAEAHGEVANATGSSFSDRPADDGGSGLPIARIVLPYTVPPPAPYPRHIHGVYEFLSKLGEGSYGSVHRVRERAAHSKVFAMKTLKNSVSENSRLKGFPMSSIREVRILKFLAKAARVSSPRLGSRIVRLEEVLASADLTETALVFEHMKHDLFKVVVTHKTVLLEEVVALYAHQLIEGICFLHNCCIMHRDLKSANVLLNNDGDLKICDFGMAREWREDAQEPMTPRVGTLWYRAPEVILASSTYSRPVDVWAAGCIIAEMFLRRPLFEIEVPKEMCRREDFEAMHLQNIFAVVGPPPDDLAWASRVPLERPPGNLATYMKMNVPDIHPLAVDLLTRMLSINPALRPTPHQLLQDKYFYVGSWSDRDAVKKRLRRALERQPYCCETQPFSTMSNQSGMGSGISSTRSLAPSPIPSSTRVLVAHRSVGNGGPPVANSVQRRQPRPPVVAPASPPLQPKLTLKIHNKHSNGHSINNSGHGHHGGHHGGHHRDGQQQQHTVAPRLLSTKLVLKPLLPKNTGVHEKNN